MSIAITVTPSSIVFVGYGMRSYPFNGLLEITHYTGFIFNGG
jgi:hypothetical protein